MHDISLITTIAFGLTAALAFGLLTQRIGLSPIVGYLLGGIVVGPYTPGFVGNVALAGQLAEIGVILLMFGVGLHFHLKDLLAVRSIAIPGALLQSTAATAACMAIAILLGWSTSSGLVLGVATSVASTVVLLRVVTDNGLLDSTEGHVAVGWLVVEDIITILVLVLLPAFAAGAGANLLGSIGLAIGKLVILGGIVALAGARFVPWLLLRVARLRSRELFTLTVLVLAMAVATISYLAFGASMALGAFLAGMVVGQSKLSSQAAADAMPMRDAFAVLFFVSVGMLFDYGAILADPILFLCVLGVVLVVKPLAAFTIVAIGGHSLRTALTAAGALSQIGEFSFILAEGARALGLLPGEGYTVIVAAAIVSISLNPILFRATLRLEPWLSRSRLFARLHDRSAKELGEKINEGPLAHPTEKISAIVVGFGPIGRTVDRLLSEFGIEPLVLEMNVDTVLERHATGKRALYGDATSPVLLESAGVTSARYLIVTIPDPQTRLHVIATARGLNPNLRILARARYLQERDALLQAGADAVCFDEGESAVGLAEVLLRDVNASAERIAEEVVTLRRELGSGAAA